MLSRNKFFHRFSVLLSTATLFLIFVGGLVTSTDSGLSVPDWPLSYGRLMPPMIGGIFYEHGHRMVATFVGLLTIVMAAWAARVEDRPWVKRAAWIALGLVITQGVLGGLTVIFRLPAVISIAHATLAQTFFSLTVALAVWTSPLWRTGPTQRTEAAGKVPLHQIAASLFLTLYLQLILGAVVRHSGWGVTLHMAGACLATFLAFWTTLRSRASGNPALHRAASWMVSALTIQVALGITTYLILGHEFSVIPIPIWATLLVTAHVATGALVMGLTLITALLAYRTRPHQTVDIKTTLSDYFELTKPGISFTAGITALAGFVLGSAGHVAWVSLIHTGIGVLLVAAGACTLNMVIEVDIDKQMKRTQNRPLPSGRMLAAEAMFLGVVQSVAGVVYLSQCVNALTALIAGLTLAVYLYVYTPLKKVTWLCTLAGAVAGALPPVMGWTAATGKLGVGALVLFGILFFWQFPHFFSLAWLYKEDYERAGLHMIPVMPTMTASSMILNSVALLVVSLLPTVLGMTGNIYLLAAAGLSGWLVYASIGFFRFRSLAAARKLFFASIVYVPALVVVMVLNTAY